MKYSKDTWSQVLGTKDVYMDRIHRVPDVVNGIEKDNPLISYIDKINLRSFYNKNLVNYIGELSLRAGIVNVPTVENWHKSRKKFNEDNIKVISGKTANDFWQYQMSLLENGLIIIKEKTKIEKDFVDYHLPKDQNTFINKLPLSSSELSRVMDILASHDINVTNDFCYCEDSSISSVQLYVKEIYTPGHLLNDLFNFKCEAVGRGEVLLAFIFRDSVIHGASASFDLMLVDGTKIEIKAPQNSGGFRIGVQGSIGSSTFFSNLLDARRTLRILFKQHGKEWFKNTVSSDFYESSISFLAEGDFKKEPALSSAIDYAELNANRLLDLKLWFFLAHVETFSYRDNTAGVIYDPAFDDFIARYGNPASKIETLTAFTFLKYVKDPMKYASDLEDEIDKWMKHAENVLIFNEDVNINFHNTPDDMIVDAISQNGFKVKERYNKKINTSVEQAFAEWNDDPEGVSFYKRFKRIDSQK